MPRPIAGDNGTPRRRRSVETVAVEADAEPGLAMRILLYSPKDMVAGAMAFAVATAIIANALFLQAGRHPAPMFRPAAAAPATGSVATSLLPRPRPAEADAAPAEPKLAEPKLAEPKSAEPRGGDPKPSDPLTNLVKSTSATPVAPISVARPPAPIPSSSRPEAIASSGSRRVAAVQRTLTEYGYGQLRPTGTVGSDTQAAIQKFERDRKIPVTGQMSDRLVRELSAVIGHPID